MSATWIDRGAAQCGCGTVAHAAFVDSDAQAGETEPLSVFHDIHCRGGHADTQPVQVDAVVARFYGIPASDGTSVMLDPEVFAAAIAHTEAGAPPLPGDGVDHLLDPTVVAMARAAMERVDEASALLDDLGGPWRTLGMEPAAIAAEVDALMGLTISERAEAVAAVREGRMARLGLRCTKLLPTAPGARAAWARLREAAAPIDRFTDGGSFIFDIPSVTPAVWGVGGDVLWAEGEALMIAGPQGVGKSTLAGLLVRGMITGESVLGLPVKRLEDGGRVLYLAMDRPQQIARALARQLRALDRVTVARALEVWAGPPPVDLAADPDALLRMAQRANATVVVVDSLKDAALGLAKDEVAAGWNRARQICLAAGVQVLEVHHNRKVSDTNAPAVEQIYGNIWITSGLGSIIKLSGEPGDPIVGFRHLKQPDREVGPLEILHDQAAGVMTVQGVVDLVECAANIGITAQRAAELLFDATKPDKAEVEKARRRLEALVTAGKLVKDPTPSPVGATVYRQPKPLTVIPPLTRQ